MIVPHQVGHIAKGQEAKEGYAAGKAVVAIYYVYGVGHSTYCKNCEGKGYKGKAQKVVKKGVSTLLDCMKVFLCMEPSFTKTAFLKQGISLRTLFCSE